MAYEINININGDLEAGTTAQAGISKTASSSEQSKALKSLGQYVAAQTIQPFIQNVKTQISQNIGIATGNIDLQQRVNFGMEVIQYGVNVFKNASAGASIATALGGSASGGVLLGIALTLFSSMVKVGNNISQLDLKEGIENYQLDQVRNRQGFAYNRSRRGI